ncbi:hypothetical protein BRADI_1g13525v3 [Brachypodium distachyon]|uniref:Uncharacterized protein n=1 Tax=Brachypodium distachyon TaxID=15368 RepID=A0A0Q3JPS4_BRADI|nr:hypothetical protein BRADI_1g13525v3 [Brachypodium distachyon]
MATSPLPWRAAPPPPVLPSSGRCHVDPAPPSSSSGDLPALLAALPNLPAPRSVQLCRRPPLPMSSSPDPVAPRVALPLACRSPRLSPCRLLRCYSSIARLHSRAVPPPFPPHHIVCRVCERGHRECKPHFLFR